MKLEDAVDIVREKLASTRFHRELGRGGQGVTWLVTREEKRRVVKVFLIGGEAERRSFQKEVETLQAASHPRLPELYEHEEFQAGEGRHIAYSVQEYVPGRSLMEIINDGDHLTDAEIDRLAKEILETLEYLHNLEPPVIHRDVKPPNIIRREDDSFVLVDFGASTVSEGQAGGQDIIATTGYAPPEQYFGEATERSDLYALGTTLIHALSHRHPADFLDDDLQLNFEDRVHTSDFHKKFLHRLTAKDPENRFQTAAEAVDALENRRTDLQIRNPKEASQVQIYRSDDGLVVQIPSPIDQIRDRSVVFSKSTFQRKRLFRSFGAFLLIGIVAAIVGLTPGSLFSHKLTWVLLYANVLVYFFNSEERTSPYVAVLSDESLNSSILIDGGHVCVGETTLEHKGNVQVSMEDRRLQVESEQGHLQVPAIVPVRTLSEIQDEIDAYLEAPKANQERGAHE